MVPGCPCSSASAHGCQHRGYCYLCVGPGTYTLVPTAGCRRLYGVLTALSDALQGDAGNDARAGPPTRKRRLDFTNISEGSPSLAFATAGDSPYTSKLDMLAAAASEAAGQAPTPVTSNASLDLRQSGPSSAAAGAPLQPSPTVDRENAPPTRTPRRGALAAAAAAARARSPDDMDAVNSPSCDVLTDAAAGGGRGKRGQPPGGVCHDFAIDLQKRAGDGVRGRNGKVYPEAKPDMLGRSHHPMGASNVRPT